MESEKRKPSRRGPKNQSNKNQANQKSEENKKDVQKSEKNVNPDKMSVFLKRVGDEGKTKHKLSEGTFYDLLNECNSSWCDVNTTLVYPLYPDPTQHAGPTGLKIVPKDTDKEKEGNVIGFTNEMKVIRAFERCGKNNDAGLKIFPGVKITFEKLQVLAQLFGGSIDELNRCFNYFCSLVFSEFCFQNLFFHETFLQCKIIMLSQ